MTLPPPALPGSGSTVGGAAATLSARCARAPVFAPDGTPLVAPGGTGVVVVHDVPAREQHEQRDDQADDADDHQDQAHRLQLDTRDRDGDRVAQDRAQGDQEDGHSETHSGELYPPDLITTPPASPSAPGSRTEPQLDGAALVLLAHDAGPRREGRMKRTPITIALLCAAAVAACLALPAAAGASSGQVA